MGGEVPESRRPRVGVRDAAIPAPMAGCMTNHGATIVTKPSPSGGQNVGDRAHSGPHITSRGNAKAMPIE